MNRDAYLFLLRTYGRKPGFWVSVGLAIVQTILLRVATIFILAQLVADLAAGDYAGARFNIILQLCVGVLGLLLRLARELIGIRAENAVYRQHIIDYYRKLVGKDMAFYRDHQTGYLASSFRQHLDSGMELVRLLRGEAVQTLISLTIPVVVLLFVSVPVGLTAIGVILVQLVYVFWASASVNSVRMKAHEIYRKISGTVSDDVTNIVAYKTSGAGEVSVRRLESLANQETTAFWQRRKRPTLLDAPRDIFTMTGATIAYWIIVSQASGNAEAVGLAVLTISYMFQIFAVVTTMPDMIARHDDIITRLHPTLKYITSADETITDPAEPKKMRVSKGAMDISELIFSYNDGDKVFDGLNLQIPGGQQVGVVGLSGAGKSTLAGLLMRFDDVTGGSIKLDGYDIRDVRQQDLRRAIAYVPQEPLLFHRTIRENLLYFAGGVSEEDMIAAAKAAHAHEFIQKLPQGYDTMVGERGVKLSGGQKQRVVIARAILKNAPVMLFDEATSALDSESEQIIQRALPDILGKRTAIIIAHRLSTVAGLDRIIVMQDGKIIEDGTHEQLLKQKGRYYSLWQKQTKQLG